MLNEARSKMGLFPVTVEDIRFIAAQGDHPNVKEDDDNKILYGPDYYPARIQTGKDFCCYALEMHPSSINVFDFRMCVDANQKIMWITVTPDLAKRIFQQASRIKNRSIQIIQFIPPPALERKKKLNSILKTLREQDPTLRTQIRLGKVDLTEIAKNITDSKDFTPYKEIKLKTIDTMNTLPGINVNSYSALGIWRKKYEAN